MPRDLDDVVLRDLSAQGLVQQITAIGVEKGREFLPGGRCGRQQDEQRNAEERSGRAVHDASLESPDRIG